MLIRKKHNPKKYTFYLSHVIGFATVSGLLANQQPTFKELM
jgi:hypothetical protein